MLFLLSSSCSALLCLYLKRNLIKHKLVISKHKLVISTQLSLCLKGPSGRLRKNFESVALIF